MTVRQRILSIKLMEDMERMSKYSDSVIKKEDGSLVYLSEDGKELIECSMKKVEA